MNHLLEAGSFPVRQTARPRGLREGEGSGDGVTREIMTIQAERSYDRAKALIEKLVVIRPKCSARDKADRAPRSGDVRPGWRALRAEAAMGHVMSAQSGSADERP